MPRAIHLLGGCLPPFALLACAGPSADPDAGQRPAQREAAASLDAGDACGGRGEELRGASFTGSDGLRLSFLSMQPDPPIVGDNSWEVQLELDGDALTGVAEDIVVLPTMPDHNHGSPVSVGVTELDDGVYRFEPINTFMPGYWKVDIEIDADAVVGTVTLHVCVE